MKSEDLKTAMAEAERFLERARTLKNQDARYRDEYCGGRESAAVRRTSMDLSRALADLRRRGA